MTQAIEVTADTIDQLIDKVGKAHATVIVRHSSRDIDTDESHIDFLMAVPEMEGIARTTGKFARAEFAAAAQTAARDLAEDPDLADFANAWLFGNVGADDEIPTLFIDEVAARVFGNTK